MVQLVKLDWKENNTLATAFGKEAMVNGGRGGGGLGNSVGELGR